MLLRFFILTASILWVFLLHAQGGSVMEVFSKEIDNRGYDGDYNAYVVKLQDDSTIEIRVYHIQGRIYKAPVYKTIYTGKFNKNNDTCMVIYLSVFYQAKEKNKINLVKKNGSDILNSFRMPSSFILKNRIISSLDFLFPDLPKTSLNEANTIEAKLWRL